MQKIYIFFTNFIYNIINNILHNIYMKKLYIIKSDYNNEISYKIGISNNLSRRLDTFKTGNPAKLTLLFTFESNYCSKLEKALHNYFNAYNIKNEWFNENLPINEVKETCILLNKQISL